MAIGTPFGPAGIAGGIIIGGVIAGLAGVFVGGKIGEMKGSSDDFQDF